MYVFCLRNFPEPACCETDRGSQLSGAERGPVRHLAQPVYLEHQGRIPAERVFQKRDQEETPSPLLHCADAVLTVCIPATRKAAVCLRCWPVCEDCVPEDVARKWVSLGRKIRRNNKNLGHIGSSCLSSFKTSVTLGGPACQRCYVKVRWILWVTEPQKHRCTSSLSKWCLAFSISQALVIARPAVLDPIKMHVQKRLQCPSQIKARLVFIVITARVTALPHRRQGEESVALSRFLMTTHKKAFSVISAAQLETPLSVLSPSGHAAQFGQRWKPSV